MIDLTTLIAVGGAFWVIAASPGPANISNAAIAMRYGRKPSLIYGLGLSVALVFWGTLAATGMGAVLQTSIWVLAGLKFLGGCYLLWLAYLAAKSAASPQMAGTTPIGSGRWFWRGLILNLSNPKSVIAWMAALSMGLDPNDNVEAVAVTTMVCVVVAFLNNLSYSLVFSMGGMMATYDRFRRWIDGASAALFGLGGLALVRDAFSK